jgi:AraC-like DNA-binding protein
VYEVHYITAGHAKYKQNRRISTISEGDFFISPPGSKHHIIATPEQWVSQYCIQVIPQSSLEKDIFKKLLSLAYTKKPVKIGLLYLSLFEKYTGWYASSETFKRESALLHLTGFLCDLIHDDHESNQRTGYLNQALHIMQQKIFETISFNELADMLNISPPHFSREFKKTFHISPQQHYLKLKMEMACNLLKRNKDTLDIISARLGYDNESSFSRAFKKTIGMSPGEYRVNKGMKEDGKM